MREQIKEYIGIKWEEMDCWRLVVIILTDLCGIKIEDIEYSVSQPKEQLWSLVGKYQSNWTKVDKPDIGDIILFELMDRPHVAVYLGSQEFVHSTRYAGVCIERLSSPRWKRKVKGFYRHNSYFRS